MTAQSKTGFSSLQGACYNHCFDNTEIVQQQLVAQPKSNKLPKKDHEIGSIQWDATLKRNVLKSSCYGHDGKWENSDNLYITRWNNDPNWRCSEDDCKFYQVGPIIDTPM